MGGYMQISPGLDFPISVSMEKVNDFSPKFILDYIERVLTSKKLFTLDGLTSVNIIHVAGEKFGFTLRRIH